MADKNEAVSAPDIGYKNFQVYPSEVLNGFGDVPVGLTVDLFIEPPKQSAPVQHNLLDGDAA